MQAIVEYTTGYLTPADSMAALGAVADHFAAGNVFADFTSRKAENTVKAHRFDLATFCEYLDAAGGVVPSGDPRQQWLAQAALWQSDPEKWRGLTWGLVQGFVQWQLAQGASIATLNRRLATIKVYAKLAAKAGTIDPQAHALIRLVQGFGGREAKRVDEGRAKTRMSTKKAVNVALSADQAKALKSQPDTPQGRRDAVITAMLLDLGLRVGELCLLQVAHIDLKAATVAIYRPKVDLSQVHNLSKDCLIALRNWIDSGDCAPFGPLLRGSRKGGYLTDCGMSETSISERIRTLGKELGIDGLSAHDCRHYWATHHARKGTPMHQLMQAGGWKTPAMPLRYIDASKIANEGMV